MDTNMNTAQRPDSGKPGRSAPRNAGLQRALHAMVEHTHGGRLTRQAREVTVSTFCAALAQLGIRPNRPGEINHRRIRDFVTWMREQGISRRTMQNRMAHLRTLVPHAFVFQDAGGKQRKLTNALLGIDGASREGTKRALPEQGFEERLARVEHAGLRACLLLERHLGLRGMEALRSGGWLHVWQQQLAVGASFLRVSAGSKGGRGRDVHLHDPAAALAAIREALAVVDRHGHLVNAPPRRRPLKAGQKDKTLQRARALYSRLVRQAGFTGETAPHSLRYAWACDRLDAYVREGYTVKQARLMTSLDLGHGDGRGRYVQRTYGRR